MPTTKTNQTHTPGPWNVVKFPDGRIVVTSEKQDICGMWPKGWADARLIAAAPDLLAAANLTLSVMSVNHMTHHAEENCPVCKTMDVLRAAIEKAEGR